jgi:hypothetical protein
VKIKISLLVIAIGILVNSNAQKAIIVDTTTGIGKTCAESKLNAFVNSLQRINGTYINASIRISNDEIISNNITEITQGGIITNSSLIGSCRLNKDSLYESKWVVYVSTNKFTNFIKSKNNSISLNGTYISIEMEKLKKNELSETKSIENILAYIKENLYNSYDYELQLENNHFEISNDSINIPLKIIIRFNENISKVKELLIGSIEKAALDQASIDFINKYYTQNKSYNININNKLYYFQKKETVNTIINFYHNYINNLYRYKIENDCNDIIMFREKYKVQNINTQELIFGDNGDEIQTITGNIILYKDEIKKINNLNISSIHNPAYKNKFLGIKKYSQTNPFEFNDLNNGILKKIDTISYTSKDGLLNIEYIISFDEYGKLSKKVIGLQNQKNNDNNFELLKSYLMKYDLTASQQCNGFIKSEDTLKLKISWTTKNKSYTYEANSEKDEYQEWFLNKNLNYGKYTINIRERTINDKTFKTILVNDMNSVGNEAVISSVLIPGSGIKKATYSKESGKVQFWGVLIPLSISALTYLASTSSYDKYLKDPIDQNYQIANNLNKASIIFEGWGIFNYLKQIFKTAKVVKSNIAEKEKLINLIEKKQNFILNEEISF